MKPSAPIIPGLSSQTKAIDIRMAGCTWIPGSRRKQSSWKRTTPRKNSRCTYDPAGHDTYNKMVKLKSVI